MTIRYVESHDVDLGALNDLRARCDFSTSALDVLAAQIRGARWVVAAYDGDELVGFARAISDGVTNGYISSVMVDAAYRRRGVGRALIDRFVRGRDGIRWVLHARAEAMAFYRALGFEDAPDMMWRDRR